MADNPDLFSFFGDWSVAADQFLASSQADELQAQFSPEEREIIRLMLHGSIRPPQGVDERLTQEADIFKQRAMEEGENRLRGCYVGPLIGNQFLRRLTEMRSVVEVMIPEVASLRDLGTTAQAEFPEDDDVRITREFPSGIFPAIDDFYVTEADTDQIEIGGLPSSAPTIPAPEAYVEQYGPKTRSQSGLHALLSQQVPVSGVPAKIGNRDDDQGIVFDESFLDDEFSED